MSDQDLQFSILARKNLIPLIYCSKNCLLLKQFPSLALLSYCCPTSWHVVYSWFQPWPGSVERDPTRLSRWSRGLVWRRLLHHRSSWCIPPPFAKSCCKIATKRNHLTNSLNDIFYLIFHAPLTYLVFILGQ